MPHHGRLSPMQLGRGVERKVQITGGVLYNVEGL